MKIDNALRFSLSQLKNLARAVAGQPVHHRVEVIVIVGQRGNVNQAADVIAGDFDKQAERSHARDLALEIVTDVTLHENGLNMSQKHAIRPAITPPKIHDPPTQELLG